jgi:glycosyltransferase involved in cell wall biosynthesis
VKPIVTHLIEKYATTGENYVFEQALLARRHDFRLLAEVNLPGSVRPVPPEKVVSFRTQRSWPIGERIFRGFSTRIAEGWYLHRFNRFLAHEMEKAPPSLVHAHFGMMGYKCLDAVARINRPLVVTFYGVDASHGVISPYWRPRLQRMFRKAAKNIVLCDEARERLMAIGCPAEKVLVWDIGIPVTEYPYRAPRRLAAGDGVRFLIVARFVEKKGHAYLLPAFRKLVDRLPNSRLTMMGNGPLLPQIRARVNELGLDGQVEIIDTQGMRDFFPRFQAALREHDIFVLPSVVARDGDDEGGPPVVITNAMSVGLPVISTPVGGIPRAVVDGESGLLVSPNDSESLFEKMLWLSENPDAWTAMSLAGRRMAEQRFNLPTQIDRLEEIYDEVEKSWTAT